MKGCSFWRRPWETTVTFVFWSFVLVFNTAEDMGYEASAIYTVYATLGFGSLLVAIILPFKAQELGVSPWLSLAWVGGYFFWGLVAHFNLRKSYGSFL